LAIPLRDDEDHVVTGRRSLRVCPLRVRLPVIVHDRRRWDRGTDTSDQRQRPTRLAWRQHIPGIPSLCAGV